MPLGRKVGLYGTFEDPLLPIVNLRADAVAAMNARLFANAERCVFSCLNKFSIKHKGLVREVECSPTKRSGRPPKTPAAERLRWRPLI